MIWTPERDDLLFSLKSRGKSYTDIAQHLVSIGCLDATKNSVAGRLHRLNGGSESTYCRKPKRIVNGVEKQAYTCRTWEQRVTLPWPEYRKWRQERRAENAL